MEVKSEPGLQTGQAEIQKDPKKVVLEPAPQGLKGFEDYENFLRRFYATAEYRQRGILVFQPTPDQLRSILRKKAANEMPQQPRRRTRQEIIEGIIRADQASRRSGFYDAPEME